MAQAFSRVGRQGFSSAIKFTGRTLGIGLLLWLFVMVLTSTFQLITGVDFVTIEYTYFSHILTDWVTTCTTYLEGTWFEFELCLPSGFEIDLVYKTTTLDVDVATFIVVGAVDLILTVLHTLLLVSGMIIVWVINAFVIGEDSSGMVLNPISLVQLLKLIPVIGDIFIGVHGIDESIITNLDLMLTAFDDLIYSIMNGFFTGIAGIWHNIAEGILGKRSG